MRAKRRREEHAREAREPGAAPEPSKLRRTPEQTERRFTRPYGHGRALIGLLKVLVLVLSGVVALFILVLTAYALSVIRGDGALLVLVGALQQLALLAIGAMFLYAVLLGIEALFDIGDHTRESLELQREALAETQFSGVMLSEIAEALADDDEDDEEDEEDEEETDNQAPEDEVRPASGENPDPADPTP